MADINVRLNQKMVGGAYETMHYETKTNLCTHDGANLETEVDTLKTAVDTGNNLYIDKSAFDIEKVKYALKSVDAEEWIDLPLYDTWWFYSEGYSVRLKKTAINTLIIEGKFKFREYPTVSIGSPPDYIVLCELPSDITEPSQYVDQIRIFNKTNSSYGMDVSESKGIINFENKEIRLYGSIFGGNWANPYPSFKDNEFSFKVEYYYDWL